MNCSKVQSMLVDYVEDTLSDHRGRAIEAHIETCEHCRTELARIERLREDIGSIAAPEPDAAFWQEFDRKLTHRLAGEEAPAPRRAPWRIGFALATAAAAAVCAVVWLSVRAAPPEDSGKLRLARETDTFEGVTIDPNWTYNYGLYGGDFSVADLSDEETEQVEDDIYLLAENDLSLVSEDMVIDTVYEQTFDDMIDDMTLDEMESFLENLQAS
jgi:hypothetical protein